MSSVASWRIISSGGTTLTSNSYTLPRTWSSFLGVCSVKMSLAISCKAQHCRLKLHVYLGALVNILALETCWAQTYHDVQLPVCETWLLGFTKWELLHFAAFQT